MRRETGLWQDVSELPESLAATITARDGVEDVAALLGSEGVRRIVATGNGAAYYVAVALWLASLEGGAGPEVVAGSTPRWRWRSAAARRGRLRSRRHSSSRRLPASRPKVSRPGRAPPPR